MPSPTRTSYANSRAQRCGRHSGEVNLTEPDISTELTRAQRPATGIDVQSLRSIWRRWSRSSATATRAGLRHRLHHVDHEHELRAPAYNVADQSCAGGYLIRARSRPQRRPAHDPANAGSAPSFPYAHATRIRAARSHGDGAWRPANLFFSVCSSATRTHRTSARQRARAEEQRGQCCDFTGSTSGTRSFSIPPTSARAQADRQRSRHHVGGVRVDDRSGAGWTVVGRRAWSVTLSVSPILWIAYGRCDGRGPDDYGERAGRNVLHLRDLAFCCRSGVWRLSAGDVTTAAARQATSNARGSWSGSAALARQRDVDCGVNSGNNWSMSAVIAGLSASALRRDEVYGKNSRERRATSTPA